MTILTGHDFMPFVRFLQVEAPRIAARLGRPLPENYEKSFTLPIEPARFAYVVQGVWAAQCECGEPMVTYDSPPVAICVRCFYESGFWLWRPVSFPDQRPEIEAILGKRPDFLTRNYDAILEGPDDLRRENRLHGLDGS